ncbi:MAG: ATP-dependent helicase [Muricomes sp.]
MSFSKAQTDAITHGDGPCLVLAGPGSGKTTVIVNRMKYLIEELKVRPEEILVITFTKYAATEMKKRFQQLMGNKRLPVTVGTFHGIYYGILKWAYHLGPQNILSEEEKYQIIRHAVSSQEIEIFDEEDFLLDIAAEIGVVKNNRLDVNSYHCTKCNSEDFQNIYKEYEAQRKRARKIDFDDMLVLCYELFSSRPDILKMWQKKFRYILIDEFQDINKVQYDVIRMLAAPQQNLFAVGDDDQSIYGFRGADSKLMLGFQKDYPEMRQLLLDINYRSTSNIVENALKVIGNNELRFDKKIHARKPKGVSLHVQEVSDPVEESQYVLEEIQNRMESGVKAEDIAVLFRIHTDARNLVERLWENQIPFQMKEHMPNIYNHFIAKDIRTYFKMAAGSRERQDFLQIMNRPKRYIGRDSLSAREVAFEDLRKFYCDKEWMLDRVDQFEWDLKMLAKMAPYAAIQYLRKKIGYDDFLREYAASRRMQASDLFEVLSELEQAARPYASLEEWFVHVDEYTNALKIRESNRALTQSGVQLMTMHAAKGLEFDTVYIIEANEGQIPYKKSLKEQKVEEERRLFYVAMTRAKEQLKIIYVKNKNGKDVEQSRFVDELLFNYAF